jgi:hypothetical protein
MKGVSDSVLEALARALQLDRAERAHLFDLARAVRPTSSPRPRRAPNQGVRPSIQHILDGLTGAAAFVRRTGNRAPIPAPTDPDFGHAPSSLVGPVTTEGSGLFAPLSDSDKSFCPTNWDTCGLPSAERDGVADGTRSARFI